MTAAVQIYLLSRDRPEYLRQALASVLGQDSAEVEVIVSDNSERDDVQTLVHDEFPGVDYRRRTPPLPALHHFRRVIEESTAEYLVLFHDDDVMQPDYVSSMLATLRADAALVAVGCNAWVLRDDVRSHRRFMGSVECTRRIEAPADLLRSYLELRTEGPAPFPGYMYRRKALDGLYLDGAEGGKHADVTFLTKLLQRGPILWTARPLMAYRFHSGNDSRAESVGERLSWLRHMIAKDGIDRKSAWITDFKFYYWSRWWLQRGSGGPLRRPRGWREKIVMHFLATTALRLAARPSFWSRLLRPLR